MRWIRLLFQIFGWLLTPFLAWAASFFGSVGGSLLARRITDPFVGIGVTALVGGVSGFAAIILWLRLLRTSPEMRQALAVTADGTPDTAAFVPPSLGGVGPPGPAKPSRSAS